MELITLISVLFNVNLYMLKIYLLYFTILLKIHHFSYNCSCVWVNGSSSSVMMILITDRFSISIQQHDFYGQAFLLSSHLLKQISRSL
jgi:hypothetical protein